MLLFLPGDGVLMTHGRAKPPWRGCDLLRLRLMVSQLLLSRAHACDALLNFLESRSYSCFWFLDMPLRRSLLLEAFRFRVDLFEEPLHRLPDSLPVLF